jgi:hypothetical protein
MNSSYIIKVRREMKTPKKFKKKIKKAQKRLPPSVEAFFVRLVFRLRRLNATGANAFLG